MYEDFPKDEDLDQPTDPADDSLHRERDAVEMMRRAFGDVEIIIEESVHPEGGPVYSIDEPTESAD